MSLVSRIWGGTTASTSENVEVKPIRINFRYVDAIASVIGLAQIAIMNEITTLKGVDPKISFKNGRLYPKYPSNAAEEWAPKSIKASELPSGIQSSAFSFDRYWRGDSREELVFFNKAIPYVAKLYPITPEAKDQNEAMDKLWKLVKQGIDILEDSYSTQLKVRLTGELDDKELCEDKDKEEDELEETVEIKNGFGLPLQQNLGQTFNAWRKAIDTYTSPPQAVSYLKNISYRTTEKVIEKVVNEEIPENEEKASQITEKPKKEKKGNVSTEQEVKKSIQALTEPEKKEQQTLTVEKIISLENLLKEFLGELVNFQKQAKGQNSIEIVDDLARFVEMTLKHDAVPRKLFPLSEKIKKLWSLKSIQEVLAKFEDIKTHKNNEVEYALYVKELNELLDKSKFYESKIKQEFDEIITL